MAKQKKKKTQPSKRPATMADVERAKKQARAEATDWAMCIMFTVLLDKFNGADYIQDVWNEVNKLSAEIVEGRVSPADLRCVLKEEYGIKFTMGGGEGNS